MKSVLWNSLDLCKTVGGKLVGKSRWNGSGISINTRNTQVGDVFIALKGKKNDGHEFIDEAFEKGAVAAIVNKDFSKLSLSRCYVLVEDTYKALDELGKNGREKSNLTLIGITGSVGKTTTKDYLYSILNKNNLCFANKGNHNNRIGVPLSLSQIVKNTKFAIQEMGMSLPGEIKFLSNYSKPDCSIITSIGGSHLENFNSVKEIANTKAEIFYGMEKDGLVILPGDCKYLEILKNKAYSLGLKNILYFGKTKGNDAEILSTKFKYNLVDVTMRLMGQKVNYKVHSHQPHNVINSIAAILAAKAIGLDFEEIKSSISNLYIREGRGNIFYLNHPSGSKVTLVNDSYNASYQSTASAILSLRNLSLSPPLLILGDMLELGKFSENEHNKLIPLIEGIKPRLLLAIGKQMSKIAKTIATNYKTICFDNSNIAINEVPNLIQNNDLILIKGSNGMRLDLIVNSIKDYFHSLDRNEKILDKENIYVA